MKILPAKLKKVALRHMGLYLLFMLMVMFGSITSGLFEWYSLWDVGLLKTELAKTESGRASFSSEVSSRIFKQLSPYADRAPAQREDTGRPVPKQGNADFLSNFYFVFLLVWLLPLYRYYFSKKPQNLARIERRIINLPLVIFALGWVMAAQHYYFGVNGYYANYGPVPGRVRMTLAIFSLLMGAFITYLNLEVTGLYIRRYIAKPFFDETNPHGLKSGFAASLTMRYALMLFLLGVVPLLLCLYVPIFTNMDLFSRLAAAKGSDALWSLLVSNASVLLPICVIALLLLLFFFFQAVSVVLYRLNVQRPVSALVRRMKAVAAGDFDCKTSVLYADELGQLKGHFNMMLDGLVEREKIKDTFGRYVSMEIAEKIMKSGKVNLAGEEIQATVLFSDIRGFTPLSEKMPPGDLIRFLNDYFTHITGPITANRGVINKFIGDAVMAVFSPVFGVEDHQAAAVRAALGMEAALKEFNALGRYPEIRFGVGVHSGGLVAGNVGTEARLEYTVLGDTVNVASRIESQTKSAGSSVLVSSATVSALNLAAFPGVNFVECAPVLMKGKSKPMVLFKVEENA